MPTAEARRLCPNLVLLPCDFERYTQASREVMAIFESVTPLVEQLSIDEAFLDVRGMERIAGTPIEIPKGKLSVIGSTPTRRPRARGTRLARAWPSERETKPDWIPLVTTGTIGTPWAIARRT